MWNYGVSALVLLYCFGGTSSLSNHLYDDDEEDERPVFNYNQYLRHPYSTKVDSKSKVETLGGVLKGHIHHLKNTSNKEIDIVFLVDSSTSVGKNNFREEIKFVKKLLSDFTVDANHTRVSVITFSSRGRVIRHVDYLDKKHENRHKCSLLENDLKRISYSGGGTFTLGAFKEARKVFENGRPTANKAIFLVTDGFSNGGDPRGEARAFRNQGIKIFTFGIQNGNVRELYDMASRPKNESCYILDSFEEFEALAGRALHEDLKSGRYIDQPNKRCDKLCVGKKCCDPLATCSCGTHTGQYECICPAGYYGNGLKGGCQACPSGTYKPDMRPGDDYTCKKCPDEKHITEPGATSLEQCTCQKGYRTFNGTGCAVLKCPVLSIPKNGYFVNDKCKNVFNAACGLRCKPGYELRGSSLRICREDGTWSGQETECIMKTCPALMIPKNGNMICTTDDFTFNTVCRFTCDTGYKLVGSRKRTCLAIAFWTGINTRCREITCRPLPVVRDGSIHPAACTADDVIFGTTCSVTCSPGYSLSGPHSKQCLPEGVWSPATEVNECVDTSPPFIMCPYNVEVDADLNEKTGTVSWQVPLAVDNSGYIPILTSVPAILPPAQFPIGRTKVTYEAEDLNKNKASCQFYIVVKDKQKPQVDRCVSPKPVVSPEQYAEVTWDEPEFSDNSEEDVRIQRSHAPGLFPMGKTEVVFTAYDSSGNNNTCTFNINVIPHPCEYPPIPLNGNRTCYESTDGVVCKFFCKPGHRFAIPPAEEYMCAYDNVWQPQEKMPISDCSALKLSKSVIQPASFTFSGKVACKHRPGLVSLEKSFEHRIGKRIDQLCQVGLICGMVDLETECTQLGGNNVHVILGRNKRNADAKARVRREAGFEETVTETVKLDDDAIVTFTYKLTGTVDPNAKVPAEKAAVEHEKLLSSVENIVTALRKDVKTGDFDLAVNGRPLTLVNMSLDQSLGYKCDDGSVRLDNGCAECPTGAFFNVVSLKCQSCDKGTFQPGQGQLSCLVCPANFSTPSPHSVSMENCTAQCLPGSFSESGLEICETCKRGYYQSEYGQNGCNKCPKRYTTLRRGSRRLSDCKEKCSSGHISKTGVEPCWPCPVGSYQSRIGKSSCMLCPHKAATPTTGATNVSQCELELSDGPQNEEPFDLFGGGGGTDQEQLLADECMEMPCKNDAECKSRLFGFKCICKPGFEGTFCGTPIDECKGSPCQNGGTCIDLKADYLCSCVPGFTGKKCDVNINDCAFDTCLNGGTCLDEVEGISCVCGNGFTGLKCDVNIDECTSESCLNGGTCVDEVAGYSCKCPDGIRGANCEINDDDCASGPCQNEAECVDGSGTYTCKCPHGYEGVNCELDIDECVLNPCGVDAKCENLPGTYKCNCFPGYTGVSCKEEIDMYFQLDFPTTATTMDYAKVKVGKDLTTATVCFWMKTDDQENQGTPFSYATPDGDNVFTLSDYDRFVLYVNGDKVTTRVQANDGKWHQICVLWVSNRGEWKFYMDGLLEDSGRNLAGGQTIKGGGLLVVGQEQDVVGGDFSKPEAFIGKITQLNMWSSELPLTDIEDLRLDCRKQLGDVVAWTDIAGEVHGAVTDSPVEFCKERCKSYGTCSDADSLSFSVGSKLFTSPIVLDNMAGAECPAPSAPEEGSVEYAELVAGSEAVYSCDRGYNLAGKRNRLCLVTGEWEGEEPTCARVQCRYPGRIEQGWIEGSVYTFDNRIRYHCDRGYNLVGSKTRYCGEQGVWIGEEPKCELIKCKIEILSENTILKNPTADNTFEPNTDAFFACKEGNVFFTEHTSVYCQRDGTWDRSIPSCDPQTCPPPPPIVNGHFPNVQNYIEFSVGGIANYVCDFGYNFSTTAPNPTGKVTCTGKGVWSPEFPVCDLVDCGNPLNVANSNLDYSGTQYLDVAEYSCKAGYELSGADGIVECLEDGEWYPEPPDCIPLNCGRPDDILNGRFSGIVFTYKGEVEYICDLGYFLVGTAKRTCLADASWSGEIPVCKPVSCGKPEAIENGEIAGRDFTLNNIITYSCDVGFNLIGSEERLCRETGKWSNSAAICVRVECGLPPQIKNGFYFETGAGFYFEDTVTYNCEDGYKMKGDDTISCQSSGAWSASAPECFEVFCSQPASIDHGYLSPASGVQIPGTGLTAFKIGERAQFICDEGYEFSLNSLNPLGQIECLATGNWEANYPLCSIIQCREPLPIFNGLFNVESYNYQGTVTYVCDEGYKMHGEASMVCQANGNWDGELPRCTAIKCEAPSFFRNGRSDFKDLTLGSVVRYMCNEGYKLEGLEVRRCLANLSWSGDEPHCAAVICGPPEDIANGSKQTDGVNFQSTVTYNCNPGYYLVGDRTRLCTKSGSWSGAVPYCEIVQCDKPSPIISNGRMIGEVYSYGSVIEYVCDEGYYIEGTINTRRCLPSGSWDSPIPVCVAVECPRLKVVNGFTSGFQTEYGTTLTVTCRSGYRLEGDSERTCQQDGSWSGKETVCVKYACPRLSPPDNGQVFVRDISATYLCLEGFRLHGTAERTCQANNTWSGADPRCDAIMCEDITQATFDNGFLTYESLEYGSSIVYECDVGYILKGDRKLECMVDGQWDGTVPFCEKKNCFPPYAPLYSKITGDDYSYGATIFFQCDEGYHMTGDAQRTCRADGSWSGQAITCDFIVCPRPEAGSNVLIDGTDYTYNSTITISCNSGYKLIGPKVRVCSETGQWSGDEPRCERSECPRPPRLENGRIVAPSYDQASTIMYRCNEGYQLSGPSLRLCLGTLKWSGNDPSCVVVVCGEPPELDHGFFTGTDFQFNGIVEYFCDEGYDLVGENRRRCLSVGQWGGADPTCIRVSCGVPRLPKHAVLSLPDDADAGSYEMTATLSCDVGYIGIGTNTQFCQASGEWTETNFECEIVKCGEFPGIQNGRFTGFGISFGDEIQIQCDEGYSLLGKSVGRCLASGEWGFGGDGPVCEQILCPALPTFTNGQVSYEGGSNTVGQAAVYSCNEGYRLQGDNKRYCQTDAAWSGADPFCRLIICLNPPFVANAVPFDSSTSYYLNSKARYVCKLGYTNTHGNATLRCNENGEWAGQIPICSVVQCGDPVAVEYSRINVPSHDYQSEAEYECDEGYRIKGTVSPIIKCNEDGNWVGILPTCVPISCGEPPNVPNSILIDSQEHTFNSQVTYICEDGYTLIGQQTSTCLATGVWSGTPPTCQPVSCGEPPDIDFAFYTGDSFEYTSTVEYNCAIGYEISGDPILECLYTAAWSSNRPVCHQIKCGHPPVIPNAMTTAKATNVFGTRAHVECNDGYYLLGSASAICGLDGQWGFSGDAPSCLRKRCGIPEGVTNGHVDYSLTTFEAETTYTCNEGYFVKGQEKRVCGPDGGWSGDAPSCEPVSCGRPTLNDHVQMIGNRFTYQSVVDYLCDEGFKLVGDHSQECMANGLWFGEPPACHRITCPALPYPKHGIILNSPGYDGNSYAGDTVSFVCDEGFDMVGDREIDCEFSGQWSQDPPTCNIDPSLLRCPEDTGIPNTLPLDSPYPLSSTVELTCRPGFTTNSGLQTTCLETTDWTRPTGQCQRISCGKPPLRDFVNVVQILGSRFLYEDQIRFRCRAGVQPARSPPVITCQADGHWDGDIRCGVTCKQPCQNGGICLGLNRCKCPNGYGGRICEKAKCVLPCLHGGKCTKPYQCTCPKGYGGVRCNKAVCKKPCQHGGRCVLPNRCKCAHGFMGAFCGRKRG